MRRLIALPALALLLLACRRNQAVRVEFTEEEPAPLLAAVHVADPKGALQLKKGFYELEQNAWRWTAGKFSVVLQPPPSGPLAGAKLQFRFSLPDAVPAQLGPVRLSASVNGLALPAETYSKPGEYTYSRDVPASAFKGEIAAVDFELDKFLRAGSVDQRELGLVAVSFSLDAK